MTPSSVMNDRTIIFLKLFTMSSFQYSNTKSLWIYPQKLINYSEYLFMNYLLAADPLLGVWLPVDSIAEKVAVQTGDALEDS